MVSLNYRGSPIRWHEDPILQGALQTPFGRPPVFGVTPNMPLVDRGAVHVTFSRADAGSYRTHWITTMKALTVQQPYATLLALGEKHVETRSWQPTTLRPGELLAIHAAKNWWRGEIGGRELAATDPFASALARGYQRGLLASPDPADLPRGCVLAVARFVRCIPTDGPEAARFSARERAFGIYDPAASAGCWATCARCASRFPRGDGLACGSGCRPLTWRRRLLARCRADDND